MTTPLEYATERKAEILNELIAFARIPSVSTDPAYLQGITAGSEWVAERMRRAGLENVQINPTSGHPVVTCDWLHAEGAPTILIYGHYDVQPPDPLEKWKSPPFQPTVRDNRLYARGVSDDKGPMLIPIKTAEAYLKTLGKLPINVKFVIEGEEEMGSAHLGAFVARNKDLLKADFVLSAACFAPRSTAFACCSWTGSCAHKELADNKKKERRTVKRSPGTRTMHRRSQTFG